MPETGRESGSWLTGTTRVGNAACMLPKATFRGPKGFLVGRKERKSD